MFTSVFQLWIWTYVTSWEYMASQLFFWKIAKQDTEMPIFCSLITQTFCQIYWNYVHMRLRIFSFFIKAVHSKFWIIVLNLGAYWCLCSITGMYSRKNDMFILGLVELVGLYRSILYYCINKHSISQLIDNVDRYAPSLLSPLSAIQ